MSLLSAHEKFLAGTVQNAAARLLTGTKKRDHITLASLHWLPVCFRIVFKILLFVFKMLNGLAPQYLTELLHVHTPVRALRSSNQMLLDVPKSPKKLKEIGLLQWLLLSCGTACPLILDLSRAFRF